VPLAGDGHHPLRPVRDPGRSQQAHEEAAQLHRRADLHEREVQQSQGGIRLRVMRPSPSCGVVCSAVRAYQEVAGVGEALGVPRREGDDERAELADGDCDEAADDEHPVPVAGGEQLRADAAVLREDLSGGGGARLHVEHAVDALEAQDLELAGEAEQHADKKEHPRAVHPRRHRGEQRHRAPRHEQSGEREHRGGRLHPDGAEEEDGLVRGLHAERREQERGQGAERAVQLPRVPAPDEGGVVAERAVEEQQLPEAAEAAEEGGQRGEGDDGEPRGGGLRNAVEGDGGRRVPGQRGVGAERQRHRGGDQERQRHERRVRGGATRAGAVVQRAPLQEHAEAAQLVVDHRLALRVRRVQQQRLLRRRRRRGVRLRRRALLLVLRVHCATASRQLMRTKPSCCRYGIYSRTCGDR